MTCSKMLHTAIKRYIKAIKKTMNCIWYKVKICAIQGNKNNGNDAI